MKDSQAHAVLFILIFGDQNMLKYPVLVHTSIQVLIYRCTSNVARFAYIWISTRAFSQLKIPGFVMGPYEITDGALIYI